jgi:hypothetical protein
MYSRVQTYKTESYKYIQTDQNEDGQYECDLCHHAFEDEGDVCWADELYEGREYSQSTGLPLCGDCCDEVRELANRDECEICHESVCCDDMEEVDDKLVCPDCYKKELAKKNEPLAINAATLYMFRLCSQEFDEWDEYDGDEDDAREFWQKTLRACSDKYDEKWFALIATPAIEKTINWHFIVTKYNEARCIKEIKWTGYYNAPPNPAKDAHFTLCAERMMAGEITCAEAQALHAAAFPPEDD